MNIASEQNCIRLYELSKWEEDYMDWWGYNKDYLAPKYDLGYLIRQMPYWVELKGNGLDIWYGTCQQRGSHWINEEAETPEDVLALILIKLFEEKIL